ncbi:sensor histidine kinase [Terriglobus tenax]|uniref:sensor histidine kinase n=1 Tax=Terriglobus tenax TaxID=1111115 RepID=UPI0021E0181D|nr:sensor histidine kinase [Terriglobus tenax]
METCDTITEAAPPQKPRRMLRYMSLLYTAFCLIQPILDNTRREWILLAIAYSIFLASYIAATELRPGKLRALSFVVLFAIGYVYVPFNNSASGLYVYPTAILPFTVRSPRHVIYALCAHCAAIVVSMKLLGAQPWSVGLGLFLTVVVCLSNLYYAAQQKSDAKLRMAHEEIEHLATVAERERIARDLHDLLGHTLTVIALKSELAGKLIAQNPDAAAAEIAEIQQTSRHALAEVREAVLGYRSQGLNAEVDRARKTLATASIKLVCDGLPNELPIAEETVLCLAIRESMTNIMRHSGATEVWMRFRFHDGRLNMTVEDNGKGGVKEEGFGLRGMRERIEALGGRLSIQSEAGTRLTIDLPKGAATA